MYFDYRSDYRSDYITVQVAKFEKFWRSPTQNIAKPATTR